MLCRITKRPDPYPQQTIPDPHYCYVLVKQEYVVMYLAAEDENIITGIDG